MTHRLIRVALVGAAGYWAGNLRRVLGQSDRFTLRALIDPRLDPGLNTFGSLDDLPDNWVEAVCVATPAPTHTALALEALERGLHVLVEKPLALSASDGEKLCAAARAHDRILMVDHTYLYSPRFETFRFALDLWEPWTLWSSIRQHDGGPTDVTSLWDLLPHDLSLLHACGFTAATITTVGDPQAGLVDLTAADGRRALLRYSRASARKVRLIVANCSAGDLTWDDLAELPLRVTRRGIESDLTVMGSHEPLAGLLDDFADAIDDRPCRFPQRSTGAAAVYGLRVIEAAERAFDTGLPQTI